MTSLIGIYGASGQGRETLPLVRQQLRNAVVRLVFIDDAPMATIVNGVPVMSWAQFCRDPAIDKQACIAVADSAIRETLTARLALAGVAQLAVRADNAVIMDDVVIGDGSIIMPFAMLTSNIRIGCGFLAHHYALVAHDCTIGDFVTFAPGVRCLGNIVIEDHAYIGTGAILRQGRPGHPLRIGQGAIVGMGAIVTRDVAARTTVVGNPAHLHGRNSGC